MFKKILSFVNKDWQIFSIWGIPTIISNYFVKFFSFIFLTLLPAGFTNAVYIFSYIFLCYFFVLLHEYGHSLTAKYFGYKVDKIMLYPFSGMACIDGTFYKVPKHEFYITLAGPAVNLVLAIIGLILFRFYSSQGLLELVEINWTIFCFNIFIPILPMDGGRILRSFLTVLFKNDFWKSTVWSVWFSRAATCIIVPWLWINVSGISAILVCFMGLIVSGAEKSYMRMEMLEKEMMDLLEKYFGILKQRPDNFGELVRSASDHLIKMDQLKPVINKFVKFVSEMPEGERKIWVERWDASLNIPTEDNFRSIIAYAFLLHFDDYKTKENFKLHSEKQ